MCMCVCVCLYTKNNGKAKHTFKNGYPSWGREYKRQEKNLAFEHILSLGWSIKPTIKNILS